MKPPQRRRPWPVYRTLEPLIHTRIRRPAIIIGGGESIVTALPKCPADAVHIGVNDHGARYLKDNPQLGRALDLIVACDKIEERARDDIGLPGMKRDGRPWGVPCVSMHPWADYRMLYMTGTTSGMAAAFVARLMGCTPVYLVGMDLYRGGRSYHDAPSARTTGFNASELEHLKRWYAYAQRYTHAYVPIDCHPGLAERLRTAGCDPSDRAIIPRERLVAELQISRIRLARDLLIDMRPFKAGEVVEVSRKEAHNLVRDKKAVLA